MKTSITILILALSPTAVQAQDAVFGHTVAVGLHEVFVGLPLVEDSPGAVNVYATDGGREPLATLKASDAASGDLFGTSLVVDGTRLVVGAPGSDSGVIYVFERDPQMGNWEEVARITAPDDRIGAVRAAAGDLIVTASVDEAAVLIFERTADGWTLQDRLTGGDTGSEDEFGASVAIDGERIYVSAPARGDGAGGVHVFHRQLDAYGQEAVLTSDDELHRLLGSSVHVLRGGVILASAPGLTGKERESGTGAPRAAAEILSFERTPAGVWMLTPAMEGLESGRVRSGGMLPLAVSDNRLLVGSPRAGEGRGAVTVYVYDETSEGWTESVRVVGSGIDRLLGSTLASDGSVAVASAPGSNYEEGAVIVIRLGGDGAFKATRLGLVDEFSQTASGPETCEEGTVAQFECSDVDLLSFVPIAELGGAVATELSDIWGWTDSATGREYALVGRTDGTSFVDITDASHPVFLGDLPLTDGARSSFWRDIKVYGDHAFIVADASGNHGMQVFDLTQLRHVESPPVRFVETARYDGISSAHNIVINEDTGFAYAVGSRSRGETCGRGLHMIDIREPARPMFAGCFADTETGRGGSGYTHDAQCVVYRGPDSEHVGKEICLGSNATALSIVDVTNKEDPVALSNATYPLVSFTHQGWLTDDHAYFFMNDETDELSGLTPGTRTIIWDVTDLDDPQLLSEYVSENMASDHNLYIHGSVMYQANYMAGLRIFDISDVAKPVEVGYFDTVSVVPDRPGFFGAWSTYPFFESGAIIVSSINEGLFILKRRSVDL